MRADIAVPLVDAVGQLNNQTTGDSDMNHRHTCTLITLIALIATSLPAAAQFERDIHHETFSSDLGGWTGNGDFFLDGFYGDVTPGGAARSLGSGDKLIKSPCMVIDNLPVDFKNIQAEVSVRASVEAIAGFYIVMYRDNTDCTGSTFSNLRSYDLEPNVFYRFLAYSGFFETQFRSYQLIVDVYQGAGYHSAFVDDARVIYNGPEELLPNARLYDDTSNWNLAWGDELTHNSIDGHLSGNGSAQVVGHVDTFAGIISNCIDLTAQKYPRGTFQATGSVKPPSDAPGAPISGVIIFEHLTADCSDMEVSNHQILYDTTPGVWARTPGTYKPAAGVQGVRVILFTYGAPDGGTTLLDDATFYLTTMFMDGFESGNFDGWSSFVD